MELLKSVEVAKTAVSFFAARIMEKKVIALVEVVVTGLYTQFDSY